VAKQSKSLQVPDDTAVVTDGGNDDEPEQSAAVMEDESKPSWTSEAMTQFFEEKRPGRRPKTNHRCI
jgi:hypothetical protein